MYITFCGTIPISYLIAHRQLNFVRNVLALPDYAVSRDILIYRANQYQGRIERRGHATHTNIEIFIVTNNRFYAHADVTSREVH